MAEALLAGAALGAMFGELLKLVVEATVSCVNFKKTLAGLKATLDSLSPVIKEIQKQNNELCRPKGELDSLLSLMEKGKQLVLECSQTCRYNFFAKVHYEKELQVLINSLERFITIDMAVQNVRSTNEALLYAKTIFGMFEKARIVPTPSSLLLPFTFYRFDVGKSFTNPFAFNYSMKSPANGNEKKEVMIGGVLSVIVISAENLPALDFMGKSDPFAALTLAKEKSEEKVEKQTRVVKDSLNPIWNQTFDLFVEDGLHDVLIVEVWDQDKFGKDFIGRCTLSLTRVIREGEYKERFKLIGAESSYLNLGLKWMHHDPELKPVGILKVKLLQEEAEQSKTERIKEKLTGHKSVLHAVLYIKPLRDKKKQSKTIPSVLNPIWNERFEFTVKDVSTEQLVVEVYKSKSSKLIGCVEIPLKELQPGKVKYVWSKLGKSLETQIDNKKGGQVQVELLYSNATLEEVLEGSANGIEANGNENAVTQREKEDIVRGVLSVTVISAEDLPALDITGKSDPYVVLTLREARSETRVVNQNLNPFWNQTFDFVVRDELHDMLIVKVWDKDTIGKDDYMGRCIISLTKVILEGEYTESFELVGAKSGSLKLHLRWRS